MAWTLIDAAESLRAEFNRINPSRDKTSDGSIGDGEHSQNSSDHNPDETGKTPTEDADSINEVHAIDVDSSGPWPAGWNMQKLLDVIVARCRSGAEKRLQNIIYNRRIISRSWDWDSWHSYSGSNPHDKHAHFSFRYGSGSTTANPENITAPWGIYAAAEDDMTPAEMTEWAKSDAGKKAIADAVWTADVDPGDGTYSAFGALWVALGRAGVAVDRVTTLSAAVSGIGSAVQAIAAQDHVDEQALADALAPAVAAHVLANLPQGADPVSQDEVTTAVKTALRDAFAAS